MAAGAGKRKSLFFKPSPAYTGRSTPEWAACDEQLDKALLLARDPILFYNEVLLYESELDDNGASQLCVKVETLKALASWGRPISVSWPRKRRIAAH